MLQLRNFESMILFFNGMYKLAIAPFPSLGSQVEDSLKHNPDLAAFHPHSVIQDRMRKFMTILRDEIEEGQDIIDKLGNLDNAEIDILTDMADWLTDIQIYCASEAARYGIPIAESQKIVMQSNFSKLDADGRVLYDENNKVKKGPNYWKPEPLLKDMLQEKIFSAGYQV